MAPKNYFDDPDYAMAIEATSDLRLITFNAATPGRRTDAFDFMFEMIQFANRANQIFGLELFDSTRFFEGGWFEDQVDIARSVASRESEDDPRPTRFLRLNSPSMPR